MTPDSQLADLRRAAESEPDNECLELAVSLAEARRGLNGRAVRLVIADSLHRASFVGYAICAYQPRDSDETPRRSMCRSWVLPEDFGFSVVPHSAVTCRRCRRLLGLES